LRACWRFYGVRIAAIPSRCPPRGRRLTMTARSRDRVPCASLGDMRRRSSANQAQAGRHSWVSGPRRLCVRVPLLPWYQWSSGSAQWLSSHIRGVRTAMQICADSTDRSTGDRNRPVGGSLQDRRVGGPAPEDDWRAALSSHSC
jgi:hypothetical protein